MPSYDISDLCFANISFIKILLRKFAVNKKILLLLIPQSLTPNSYHKTNNNNEKEHPPGLAGHRFNGRKL
jgi:hypothetical protein